METHESIYDLKRTMIVLLELLLTLRQDEDCASRRKPSPGGAVYVRGSASAGIQLPNAERATSIFSGDVPWAS